MFFIAFVDWFDWDKFWQSEFIREEFLKLEKEGIKVYMPDIKLCTDNAAMIACAGYYDYINGKTNDLNLNAIPDLKL